jgi:hypothetical protein
MRASGSYDKVGGFGEGDGVQGRVCVKFAEPRWVFDVTPCEDGIKAKQLTLWEGESADLLFVAPWSLTPAKEVL